MNVAMNFGMTQRNREAEMLPFVESKRSNVNKDRKSANNSSKLATTPFLVDGNNEQNAKSRIHVLFIRTCLVLLSLFLILHGRGEVEKGSAGRIRNVASRITTTSTEMDVDLPFVNNNEELNPVIMNPRSKNLKLAMLISFPNSGTSFTLSTVRSASRQHVAGTACLENEEQFFPVYRSRRKRGPHFIPVDDEYHEQIERPQKFILTKTHCSGYDNSPMPSPTKYLIPQERFTKACHKVCSPEPIELNQQDNDNEVVWRIFHFNESLVGSFVHLFRDPFDNIVSRWHCHMAGAEVKHPHEVNKWERTAAGFQTFCRERDEYHQFNEAPTLPRELVEAAEGVPCRTDFLRYVQWHNRAFNMTQKLNKPVHILHYLDFRDNYNSTLEKLLNFLELPHVADGDKFRWNDYSDYFTDEQRTATKRFIKFYSSPETLQELARYGIE